MKSPSIVSEWSPGHCC